ncbi:Clotting factor B [Pseudolycoriella hygida]|uniref:Clotting factor B n=1 Tax=Pseudolycoriella hygida TaxID=35572 RepID=A0A9Q0RV08_9DIPT|nr:Clotting factor B [Pseudolycoriella hygida]
MKLLPLLALCIIQAQATPMARMWHGIKSDDPVPYHVHMWVWDMYDETWPASGVLISNRHILTAAVNVYHYKRFDLRFGGKRQKDLQSMTSYEGIVHENFDDATDDNNLAIIIAPTPIEFSPKIQPIALPKQSEDLPRQGQIGTVAAFSYMSDYGPTSTVLEYGRMTVMTPSECEIVYPHIHGIVSHFFCAKDVDFNVCGGAQGAGLIVREENVEVLAGIVSFGNIWKDCASKTPPGFIKISEYVDWISEKMQ